MHATLSYVGYSTLNAKHMYNHCVYIVECLVKLHTLGYRPGADHLDPIEWRPRGFNTAADAQCNKVLDSNRSYIEVHPLASKLLQARCNFLFSSNPTEDAGTWRKLYGMANCRQPWRNRLLPRPRGINHLEESIFLQDRDPGP